MKQSVVTQFGVLSVLCVRLRMCRVSSHRYHHMHCDTPLDPHSPYEGFWWSHMGWLLDNKVRTCRNLQELAQSALCALW